MADKETKKIYNKILSRLRKYCGFCEDISSIVLQFIKCDGLNSIALYKTLTKKKITKLIPQPYHANYKYCIGAEFTLNKTLEIYGISINQELNSYFTRVQILEIETKIKKPRNIVNKQLFNFEIHKNKHFDKNMITMNPIWAQNESTIYTSKKNGKLQRIHLRRDKLNKYKQKKNVYQYRLGFFCKDGVSFKKWVKPKSIKKLIDNDCVLKSLEYKRYRKDLDDIDGYGYTKPLEWFPMFRLLVR